MITYTADKQARFRTAQPDSGSAQTLSELNVANPDESDVDFILYAFDSALPYLASIGSEAQWGTVPFSKKPERRRSFSEYAQESYKLNAESKPTLHSSTDNYQHLIVYEVQTEAGWLRVAALGISTGFPGYVPQELAAEKVRKATDYLYLNYLIVDRRTGDLAKGSGNHLVTFATEQARSLDKRIFYGDCWRGNNDGLIK
ncbi:hypothetical protein NDA16_001553 [Ustilago loliicola]|nr:hypothetical protein NDA16_001553 [Ustilago loliicola]